MTVVTEAGGTAESVALLTIYVVDRREYFRVQREVGEKYRARMGRHFPAMTLVEVSGLLEPRAKVEIEATAVI
jgi:enamine deaminase RidA (YjgF/YER057c/UK114 family)